MKSNLIIYVFLLSIALLPQSILASIDYKSGADLLNAGEDAIKIETNFFTRSSSFDQEGNEVVATPGDSYKVNDLTFKYLVGFSKSYELTTALNLRKINSQSSSTSGSVTGPESFSLAGKYLLYQGRMFKTALGLHFKKALFSNSLYDLSNPAPSDKVALGDDGLEMGVDTFASYNDKYFKYDFQFGYNKPSSSLSSELNYKALAILKMKKWFLTAGLGGIVSLKSDTYSTTPALKPAIESGPSSLFNSINREKSSLYAGIHYSYHNYLWGLNLESIISGKSTDKGQTISLNLLYEKGYESQSDLSDVDIPDYFADGYVSSYAKSGNMLRINIGSNQHLSAGTKIDIFSIHDYNLHSPLASGYVFEVSSEYSIVKIVTRFKSSGFEVGNLVRAYQ